MDNMAGQSSEFVMIASQPGDYRASVKRMIRNQIGNTLDDELKEAARVLGEEQKTAIRELVEQHTLVIRQVLEEEKNELRVKVTELTRSVV
jgi:hypothetical protein